MMQPGDRGRYHVVGDIRAYVYVLDTPTTTIIHLDTEAIASSHDDAARIAYVNHICHDDEAIEVVCWSKPPLVECIEILPPIDAKPAQASLFDL